MQAARRLLSLLCVVAFAGLVLAACGEDEEPAATSGEEASATTEVDIADFEYVPETISVSAGDTVTWTNSDEAPHTATADDEAFDTGDLARGDEGEVTFDEAGSYPYYCRFHAFMKGTVEVQ